MKNILIVGGAGYIGSHCCKYLSENGFAPVVYDNFVYGHREFVKWGPLEEGSMSDKEKLLLVLKKYKPIAVMHFAGYINVGESVKDPGKYYLNNVADTLILLEAIIECKIQNFIFSSSCAIFGYPENIPIDEAESQIPINPYGRSKLMIEQVLDDYETAHGLKSACLRYFNASGADDGGEIGEDHKPETHLIPLIMDAAMGKRDSIDIYGDDYNTPDGTCIRDYIHVLDLADAHLRALNFLLEQQDSLRLNLGNGQGYSVKEVIESVKKVTGKDFKVNTIKRREGDPDRLVGSSKMAEELIGWIPHYKSLEDIIISAWKWHLSRFG